MRGDKILIPQIDYTEEIRAKEDAKRFATHFSGNDAYGSNTRYDENSTD